MQKKKPNLFLLLILIPLFMTTQVMAADLILSGQLSGSYYTDYTILTQGATSVEATSSATLTAGLGIHLKSSFRVKAGGILDIEIADDDGLLNSWELGHFGTLALGPNDDPDGDQLTNLEEYQLGTDPNFYDPDTDDDTLTDRWELDNFGDLDEGPNKDYDGDGFTNLAELNAGTDPNNANSKPAGTAYNLQYDSNGNLIRMEKP